MSDFLFRGSIADLDPNVDDLINLEAERQFKKALSLNPLILQSRIWYSLFLLAHTLKNYDKGIEQSKIAIENDPLSAYAFACYALVLASANKNQEAIEASKTAVELEEDAMLSRFTLSYCYLCSGELEKALQIGLLAVESSNRHAWNLILVLVIYKELNQMEEALKIYQEIEVRYQDHNLPPSFLAIASAVIGNDKEALELAHIAVAVFDPYMTYLGINFKTSEAIHNIDGFDQIIKQLGFSNLNK